MRTGQDLVCIGCVGTYGTRRIIENKRAELEQRFSKAYLDAVAIQAAGNPGIGNSAAEMCKAGEPEQQMREADEPGQQTKAVAAEPGRGPGGDMEEACARICEACGVTAYHPVEKGGVLTALWNFCSDAGIDPETGRRRNPGAGCTYRLADIPLLQGTVEVCELYELTPYRLWSEGCWLCTADNGGQLVSHLRAAGYQAAVIGEITQGKARARVDGEEIAYLTRSQRDELEKLKLS